MSVRLVKAPISLSYSKTSTNDETYEREFQRLSGADDDAIGQWLKLAKAKGETQDTDKILLELVVELHRKIDSLERVIKDEQPDRIGLHENAMIDSIGFEYISFSQNILERKGYYYGRIMMPVYPKREVPIFFEAIDTTKAKIIRIHDRDQNDWNAYVTARERIHIRELKGQTK